MRVPAEKSTAERMRVLDEHGQNIALRRAADRGQHRQAPGAAAPGQRGCAGYTISSWTVWRSRLTNVDV
jgi:hypothetical protein